MSTNRDSELEYLRSQADFYRTRFEFAAADNAALRMKINILKKKLSEAKKESAEE